MTFKTSCQETLSKNGGKQFREGNQSYQIISPHRIFTVL